MLFLKVKEPGSGGRGDNTSFDCFHQVVQFSVHFPELFFQQRDRGILLILEIHDQLNDSFNHCIILNQLHRLLNDQIFQPLLLYGFLVTAFLLFGSGTFIICLLYTSPSPRD